jgi:hypothetical protein
MIRGAALIWAMTAVVIHVREQIGASTQGPFQAALFSCLMPLRARAGAHRTSSWPMAPPRLRPLLQVTRTAPVVFVQVTDPVGVMGEEAPDVFFAVRTSAGRAANRSY